MGSIGMPELIVILVIALVVFGAGKLPQIGENLGKAIRNFKSATEKEKIDITAKKPEELSEKKIKSRGGSCIPCNLMNYPLGIFRGRVYARRA